VFAADGLGIAPTKAPSPRGVGQDPARLADSLPMRATVEEVAHPTPGLSDLEAVQLDAWWRAANYLSVGQIYLMGNALLDERCVRST